MTRDGRENYTDWGLGHATVAPWLTDDCHNGCCMTTVCPFWSVWSTDKPGNEADEWRFGRDVRMDNCLRLSLHHQDCCRSGEQYYDDLIKVLQFGKISFTVAFPVNSLSLAVSFCKLVHWNLQEMPNMLQLCTLNGFLVCPFFSTTLHRFCNPWWKCFLIVSLHG